MIKKIVCYHGCFVNYFDHESGMAVVKVLQKNGFEVETPKLVCCGFPLFNSGNIDAARNRAAMIVGTLSDYAKQGYEIVYSCPTCGYALKEVYPGLLGSEDARIVADSTSLISAYLLDLHKKGSLNVNFKQMSLHVAYHTPCHLKSQDIPTASPDLMALIPGVKVQHLNRGCCGMGGTWALKSKRQSGLSEQIGAPLFKEMAESAPELIVTDCAAARYRSRDIPTMTATGLSTQYRY